MKLTPDQVHRIIRELEALDYGRLIVSVGDRGYIEITVERKVRVATNRVLTQPTKVPKM